MAATISPLLSYSTIMIEILPPAKPLGPRGTLRTCAAWESGKNYRYSSSATMIAEGQC